LNSKWKSVNSPSEIKVKQFLQNYFRSDHIITIVRLE
jgi:hypothetical protein